MNHELWTAKFTVTYLYDIGDGDHKNKQETGILVACSLANAAALIEKYYGRDLISIDHLTWIGEDEILFLDKDGKPIE